MYINVIVDGKTLKIAVGPGNQHIRWLALNAALRYQKEFIPHHFRIPQRVLNSEGLLLRPRGIICEELNDGDSVTIELRKGATISEDLYDEDATWLEDAYGEKSNLRECRFYWKVSANQYDVSIPAKVRGDYFVAPKWSSIYPQKDYGGRFEKPVVPVEVRDGVVEWVASLKAPPGSCNYKFIMEDGMETVCKANAGTLTNDQQQHHEDFDWEVPIAEEPNPDVESRPSTASSRDGAQQDPQFETDWEALKLKWMEPHMRTRIKDVVTEFYPILIDLFDSYSFMGLELHTASHTMGMDDILHLMMQCKIVSLEADSEKISWDVVCTWYGDTSGVKDPKPYLTQRVQRHHYLDLLLRMTNFLMCEKARNQGGQAPPLDEAFFRFITDILMPVMDVYDDDPIRKDAVQHNNLIALQQSRSSLRSIYSYISQPCHFLRDDPCLCPNTLKFLLQFVSDALSEEAKEKEEAVDDFNALSGEGKLDPEAVEMMLHSFDNVVTDTLSQQLEHPGHWALLFWDYFEVVMKVCRQCGPTQQYVPMFAQTMVEVTNILESREIPLPPPTWDESAA